MWRTWSAVGQHKFEAQLLRESERHHAVPFLAGQTSLACTVPDEQLMASIGREYQSITEILCSESITLCTD